MHKKIRHTKHQRGQRNLFKNIFKTYEKLTYSEVS